jgi:hypothetical protein
MRHIVKEAGTLMITMLREYEGTRLDSRKKKKGKM